jgi:hypothetical protein
LQQVAGVSNQSWKADSQLRYLFAKEGLVPTNTPSQNQKTPQKVGPVFMLRSAVMMKSALNRRAQSYNLTHFAKKKVV